MFGRTRPFSVLLCAGALATLVVACAPATAGNLGSAVSAPRVPTASPTSTLVAAPVATPTPPTAWVVGNTGGEGVYLRSTPDTPNRIAAWPDGTTMIVIGPDREAEGRTWRHVRDPEGQEGWIPAEYLLPAPANVPLSPAQKGAATATPSPSPELAGTPTPTVVATPTPSFTTESGVVVIEDTRFYRISGATPEEIQRQLELAGPNTPSGRFAGRTEWQIQWQLHHTQQAASCAVSTVDVTVRVVYTMPHWDPPADVPHGLRERWTRFFAALQTHEHGHRDTAVQAGNEIQAAIRALPPQATCEELDRTARAAAERIIESARQRDADYDRATNHGETQGARY